MIKLREVKLGDICELKYGKALKKGDRLGGDIPVYGSGGIVGYHNEALTKKPTLVVGRKGSIGEVYYASGASWTIDTAYYIDFDTEEIEIKWFEKLLKSLNLQRLNKSAAIPGLNRRDIYSLKILVPTDKKDQIRIAKVLGNVEELIKQREESIALADEFLKMKFLEMFGDLAINDRKWPKYSGEEYCIHITVGVVVRPASYYVGEGIIALRSLNVKPNKIDTSDVVYFSAESNNNKLSKSKLNEGDVVIVRTGNTGRAAVVSKELEGSNCIDLIIAKPNQKIVASLFLSHFFNSERGKSIVTSKQVGGIHKHFNAGALKQLSIPIPPIESQNQFASIVQQTEKLKAYYQQSLDELNNLYGSLSQRAFNGELDISGVEIKEELIKVAEKELKKPAPFLSYEELMKPDQRDQEKQADPIGVYSMKDLRTSEFQEYLDSLIDEKYKNKEYNNETALFLTWANNASILQDIDTPEIGDPENARLESVIDRLRASKKPFSFEEFWSLVNNAVDEEVEYEDIKEVVFTWLNASHPWLSQVFDEQDKSIKITAPTPIPDETSQV